MLIWVKLIGIMSMKNLITIIILSLLTIGSYLFLKSLTPKIVKKNDKKEKVIVATARGVTTRYFKQNNQLQYKLISPKVLEFSHHYGTELTSPDLAVFDDKMINIWQGNADIGILSSNKDHLLLKKNVNIVEMPLSNKPTLITGETMTYQAKKGLLTSELPVKINDGIIMQVSDNLTLDTKTKKLNATNKVKAVYNTNKNKPKIK